MILQIRIWPYATVLIRGVFVYDNHIIYYSFILNKNKKSIANRNPLNLFGEKLPK